MAGRDNNILCLLLYSPSGLYQAGLVTSKHYYSSVNICVNKMNRYYRKHMGQ